MITYEYSNICIFAYIQIFKYLHICKYSNIRITVFSSQYESPLLVWGLYESSPNHYFRERDKDNDAVLGIGELDYKKVFKYSMTEH